MFIVLKKPSNSTQLTSKKRQPSFAPLLPTQISACQSSNVQLF